jgi:hypothetical protein
MAQLTRPRKSVHLPMCTLSQHIPKMEPSGGSLCAMCGYRGWTTFRVIYCHHAKALFIKVIAGRMKIFRILHDGAFRITPFKVDTPDCVS